MHGQTVLFLHAVRYGSYKGLTPMSARSISLKNGPVRYGSYKGLTHLLYSTSFHRPLLVRYGSYKGLTLNQSKKVSISIVKLDMVLIKD